jgi:hypothetical protein
MTIARIIGIGAVLMFALIATSDAVYAELPCCALRDGTWVVTKTGKPASPAQVRIMENPCCTLKNGAWVVTRTGKPASPAQVQTMEQSRAAKTGGTMGSSSPTAAEPHGGGGHK